MDDACHDIHVNELHNVQEEAIPEASLITEVEVRYRNRIGRVVKIHNYNIINKDNMQMAQIKGIIKEQNPSVPSKKLKRKGMI